MLITHALLHRQPGWLSIIATGSVRGNLAVDKQQGRQCTLAAICTTHRNRSNHGVQTNQVVQLKRQRCNLAHKRSLRLPMNKNKAEATFSERPVPRH